MHQISDAAAEQPTGLGLAKYVLTFCPAYAIWSDVREVVNQFGTDDVMERTYILWIMMLLVGYSNNASSIEINSGSENFDVPDGRQNAIRWALAFAAMAKLSKGVVE